MADRPRLLVLIHGWTGDENSMWVFAHGLPAQYWVLAPRAPHATRPSGFSWAATPRNRERGLKVDDLRASAKELIAMVDEYGLDQGLPVGSFDAVGFSQGAALVATLALLYPKRVQKVGLLAGFAPDGAETLLTGHPLTHAHVFVAHGSLDDTVNIASARQAAGLLEDAGARVTMCEDVVGHKVSATCLRQLQAFLLG